MSSASLRTLTSADVAAVVDAVVDRIQPDPVPQLLTVAQVCERLAVGKSWVYDNQRKLGVIHLGDGKHADIRFPANRVAEYLERSVRAK